MKRWICFLTALCLLFSVLTGCQPSEISQKEKKPSKEKTEAIDNIDFTLDENKVKDFDTLLEEAEKAGKGEDLEAAQTAMDLLDEAYNDLVDQNQIAYVKYCLDQSKEEEKEKYLYAEEVVNQAEADLYVMYQRVYLSESPIRDDLFTDWTQAEIDMMLSYNEEIKELNNRNTQITTEFRDLKEDKNWEKNMVALYNEMVKNNNRIAQIYGYDNYYEFANLMIYQRDYDTAQLQVMRDLVASYLPDCYAYGSDVLGELIESLSASDRALLISLLYDDYDDMESDYVSDYLASLPQSAQEGMGDMFDGEHSVFTDNENAYEGAYTTFIEGVPFCFFGPGYYGCETVIHELGHYYGSKYVEPWSQPIDLAETQSQGNEWLFAKYMENHLSDVLYECYVEYKMVNSVAGIILYVMIDEFEELVYTHDRAGNLTVSQYDALMETVAESYGGINYITENVADVQSYWKYVVLESPVYYISYGVSGMAAIDLFTIAEGNMAEACNIYCKLIEEPLTEEGFLENITYAGLAGPFEESLYQNILSRYKK